MTCLHNDINAYTLLGFSLEFKQGICKYWVNNYSEDLEIEKQITLINEAFESWNELLKKHNRRFEPGLTKDESCVQIFFIGGKANLKPIDKYKHIMLDPNLVGFHVPNTGIIYLNDNIDFINVVDLKLSLIHEIGHALGVGHSTVPNEIMHFEYNPENVFTKDTINALRRIYSKNSLGTSLLNLTIWEAIGVITVLVLTYKIITNAIN